MRVAIVGSARDANDGKHFPAKGVKSKIHPDRLTFTSPIFQPCILFRVERHGAGTFCDEHHNSPPADDDKLQTTLLFRFIWTTSAQSTNRDYLFSSLVLSILINLLRSWTQGLVTGPQTLDVQLINITMHSVVPWGEIQCPI